MLMLIAGILAVLWLLGLIGHIGGGLIHLVLIVALAIFLYDLFVGRRHNMV
jgi:K+-transporting ATPase A subunit